MRGLRGGRGGDLVCVRWNREYGPLRSDDGRDDDGACKSVLRIAEFDEEVRADDLGGMPDL